MTNNACVTNNVTNTWLNDLTVTFDDQLALMMANASQRLQSGASPTPREPAHRTYPTAKQGARFGPRRARTQVAKQASGIRG